MALGTWEPTVQSYHICTFKQFSKKFLSGFFSFLPDEFRSEGWVAEIATAMQIRADTAFIMLSSASKDVGNVQLGADLCLCK